MPLTKVETHNFDNYVVTTEKLSNTAVAAFAQTLTPKISNITETDNTYTALDDTAMNTSGGFIVITGADFQSGASVIIDTSTANSTTFVNTSTLRAELIDEYNESLANPYLAAERGTIDTVIEPNQSRAYITKAFRTLRTKRDTLPARKHGNIPL